METLVMSGWMDKRQAEEAMDKHLMATHGLCHFSTATSASSPAGLPDDGALSQLEFWSQTDYAEVLIQAGMYWENQEDQEEE